MKDLERKRFINLLKNNLDKITWKRVLDDTEFMSEVGKYHFSILSSREGIFLKAFTGNYVTEGYSLNSKDYPEISDLYNEIFKRHVQGKQESFWEKVNNEIIRVYGD